MPRPHYFCHISLMLLSTAALAAQAVPAVSPAVPSNVAPATSAASPAPGPETA